MTQERFDQASAQWNDPHLEIIARDGRVIARRPHPEIIERLRAAIAREERRRKEPAPWLWMLVPYWVALAILVLCVVTR